MSWLTPEAVERDVHALITKLAQEIARKESRHVSTESSSIANALHGASASASAMRRDWFFASLGVIDVLDDVTQETVYLSKASNAYYYCHLNIVPWTNWLGSLYVHVKEAVRRGAFPKELPYGPPSKTIRRQMGPAVDYAFVEGLFKKFEFHSAEVLHPKTKPTETAEAVPPGKQEFGLKEIIRTIDIAQDDRIRGPKVGVFVLIGGPGVGKTTVALHRIPYLINEQMAADHHRMNSPRQDSELFFTQRSTLVVVWKEHLVPYLQTCLGQLDLNDVKAIHVEDWVASHLRPYVPMGMAPTQYRVGDERTEISDAKLRLTEKEIRTFVEWH